MQITKASITPPAGDKTAWAVKIEWSHVTANEGGKVVTDFRTLRCDEAPAPDFWRALQALAPVVMDACMLTAAVPTVEMDEIADEILGAINVRSVIWRDVDDLECCILTALRELDWAPAPLILNTPLAPAAMIPFKGEDDEGAAPLLEKVREHALEYIQGKRAQANLFDGVIEEVVDQVNNGALGPDVTAEVVRTPGRRASRTQ